MTSLRWARLVIGLTLLSVAGAVYAQDVLLRPLTDECGISTVPGTTPIFGNGAAAADFDKDGDIDFYLTTAAGTPDRLYQNDGSGYFTDIAQAAGIDARGANRAALWFDYDGDHRLDLVVAGEKCPGLICNDPVRLSLYRQLADFTFTEVTDSAVILIGDEFDYLLAYGIGGLSAGDLNGDEFPDLLLTVWGGGIKYFQNNTDGTFTDRTDAAGFFLEAPTPWQTLLYDFNGDGLMDVFCNVDFAPNKLWINQGGTFTDQAAVYGLQTAFNEMGMATSDVDNDGDLDIYLTNITRDFRGTPQHNVLFVRGKTDGRPFYTEISTGLGVSRSGWDWGTTFTDINNDGRQDLLTTNGWWDERAYPTDASRLWMNTTAGFLDVSAEYGFNDTYEAATLLAFDKDRDGDADILQTVKDNTATGMPMLIYENNLNPATRPGKNHLTIKPRMAGANHFAIGAKVTVFAEGLTTARLITAGCSFYGQEPAEAFFGIGVRDAVREVRIDWPGGKTSLYRDIPINQVVQLDYEYINAPTELTVTSEDMTTLRWRDNSNNETSFDLQWSDDESFATYSTLALDADANSHEIPTPEPGSNTYYRLSAANGRVSSGYSNTASLSVPAVTAVVPVTAFTVQNPVRGKLLSLTASLPRDGQVHLSVYDLAGRLLWQARESFAAGTTSADFPLGFTAGVYLLRLRYEGEVTTHKLLIPNN